MRILSNGGPAPHLSGEVPDLSPTPACDPDRVDTLEKVLSTVLHRVQVLEEKVKVSEQRAKSSPKTIELEPAAVSVSVSAPPPAMSSNVSVDALALKKGLLEKMWKYLHDDVQSRTA